MFDLSFRQKIAATILLGFLLIGGLVYFLTDPLRKAVQYREERACPNLCTHVCGAVAKPGVVTLPPGARIDDALKKAGGSLPNADLEQINLAAFVEDGEQIYLPKKGEVVIAPAAQSKAGASVAQVSHSTRFSKVKNPVAATTKTPTSQPKIKVTWPLDLNQASQAQLEMVPGIGPVMAGKILAYRQTSGPFVRYEDLTKVKGIGKAKLEKFRAFLCVK